MKKGGSKKAREAVLRINSYLSEMETFQSEMAIWEARRKEALTAIREWTETFAPVIRGAGGKPALYMVWPSRSRWRPPDHIGFFRGCPDHIRRALRGGRDSPPCRADAVIDRTPIDLASRGNRRVDLRSRTAGRHEVVASMSEPRAHFAPSRRPVRTELQASES